MAPITRSSSARTESTISESTISTKSSSRRRKFENVVEVVVEKRAAGRKRIHREKAASKPPTIDTLCNKAFVSILEMLSRKEKAACRLTCKHWNSVILSSPTLWMNPAPIKGGLKYIRSTLAGRLCTLSGGGQLQSLSLYLDQTDMYDFYDEYEATSSSSESGATINPSSKANLASCFPSTTLREIRCMRTNDHQSIMDGVEGSEENTELWQCITSCSRLKVLQWLSEEGEMGCSPPEATIDYRIVGTPLADCRLDDFAFDCPYEPKIDDAYFGIISQVKRLYIRSQFTAPQMESIFDAVKDVVEEFTFTNYTDSFPGWKVYDAMEAKMLADTIEMPRLRKFNAAFCCRGAEWSRSQLPSPFQIIAPKVTSLCFSRLASIDWALIESCRSTLESFSVGTGGDKLPDRMQRELFNMPALVDLALDLTNDDTRDYRCDDSYFFTNLCDAIDRGDTGEVDIPIRDVLPRLKSLTIVDDENFTFDRIMGLLRLRQQLCLSAIESLTVWTYERVAFNSIEIGELKSKVPKLIIRDGEKFDFGDGIFCDEQLNRAFDLESDSKTT